MLEPFKTQQMLDCVSKWILTGALSQTALGQSVYASSDGVLVLLPSLIEVPWNNQHHLDVRCGQAGAYLNCGVTLGRIHLAAGTARLLTVRARVSAVCGYWRAKTT